MNRTAYLAQSGLRRNLVINIVILQECKNKQDRKEEGWVQWSRCGQWYHCGCVDLELGEVSTLEFFIANKL